MGTDVQIRAIAPAQRELLATMYDGFDPLGAALGLPPHSAEVRRDWIGRSLQQKVNVAAFSADGTIVGHCFLAADTTGSAEMAVFVHQEFRWRGIGTELVTAALACAQALGLRRVWSVTSFDNRAALRLLRRCGFQVTTSGSLELELEIELGPCVLACGSSPGRLTPV